MVGVWNPLSQPVIHKQVQGTSVGFPSRTSRTGLWPSSCSPQKSPWPFLESPVPEPRGGGEALRAHQVVGADPEAVVERADLESWEKELSRGGSPALRWLLSTS